MNEYELAQKIAEITTNSYEESATFVSKMLEKYKLDYLVYVFYKYGYEGMVRLQQLDNALEHLRCEVFIPLCKMLDAVLGKIREAYKDNNFLIDLENELKKQNNINTSIQRNKKGKKLKNWEHDKFWQK